MLRARWSGITADRSRAYLRQQADYGQAEALLRFKHPDKFNDFGHGKWRGMLYRSSLQGPLLEEAIIYRGTFGTGLFQCIYQPGPAHWAMLPSTLEWHLLVLLIALTGFFWPLMWFGGLVCWLFRWRSPPWKRPKYVSLRNMQASDRDS